MDMQLKIDVSKCWKCSECVRECPAQALVRVDYPEVAPGGEERCLGCQHCLAVCPTGAMSIFGRNPLASAVAGRYPEPEKMLSLLRNRRSFRRYKSENIAPELLKTLLAALDFTPTGCNAHSLKFVVIDDVAVLDPIRQSLTAKLMKKIASGAPEAAWYAKFAPGIRAGIDVLFRGAPHILFAAVRRDAPCAATDPIIALSQFELLAQDMGLGTTWCGLVTGALQIAAPEMLTQLGLDGDYQLGYSMLFGPPAVRFKRTTQPFPCPVEYVKPGQVC